MHKSKPTPFRHLALFALLLTACHHGTEEPAETKRTPPPVLTVSAYTVSARPIREGLSLTGSIQAQELVTVQPATAGLKVTSVLADEGDYVKTGQLLVTLDSRQIHNQLATARNRLASSGAQLQKTRTPVRSQEIARLEAAVDQAEVAVNDAANNELRATRLFAEQVITKAELDSRKTALANALTVLRQQREALNLALAGARSEDVTVSRLGVSDARLQIDQLNLQLEQSQVRAPVGGLILSRGVSLGEISSFSGAYFTMAKNGALEFRALVPEADLHRVPIGAKVLLRSDANPALKASGVVYRLGASVDAATRQGTVRIAVLPGSGLKVGQFVRGELETTQGTRLSVPLKSIVSAPDGARVFVLDKGIARARKIETGAQSQNLIEVLAGLKRGDQIVEDGVGFLKDGDPVKIVASPGLAKAKPAASPAAVPAKPTGKP